MFSSLPPVTKALLIANGVAFLLQLTCCGTDVSGALDAFDLWPIGLDQRPATRHAAVHAVAAA